MSDERLERLAAKVRAVNRVNAYAAELHAKLAAAFRPLEGQKILKADGSLLVKYAGLVPKDHGGLQVYRHRSDYSLAWCVKTSESVEGAGFWLYYETVVYVGRLGGAVLTDVPSPMTYRSDFTVEEVKGKRLAFEQAQQAMRDAQSELYPFGESDR